MSKNSKNVCTFLNYIEHLLILVSAASGCASIFVFAFLVCIPVGIASSALGIKISAITVRIKKCK